MKKAESRLKINLITYTDGEQKNSKTIPITQRMKLNKKISKWKEELENDIKKIIRAGETERKRHVHFVKQK